MLSTLAAAHMPTGTVPFTALPRTIVRDFGMEPRRLQRESNEEARARTEEAFADAESLLTASFDWWNRETVRMRF